MTGSAGVTWGARGRPPQQNHTDYLRGLSERNIASQFTKAPLQQGIMGSISQGSPLSLQPHRCLSPSFYSLTTRGPLVCYTSPWAPHTAEWLASQAATPWQIHISAQVPPSTPRLPSPGPAGPECDAVCRFPCLNTS